VKILHMSLDVLAVQMYLTMTLVLKLLQFLRQPQLLRQLLVLRLPLLRLRPRQLIQPSWKLQLAVLIAQDFILDLSALQKLAPLTPSHIS